MAMTPSSRLTPRVVNAVKPSGMCFLSVWIRAGAMRATMVEARAVALEMSIMVSFLLSTIMKRASVSVRRRPATGHPTPSALRDGA